MTAGIILALLYVGRDVLIPVTFAVMLSLLVAPLVRGLRRIGAGRISSVLIAVLMLSVSFTAAAMALGTQILHIAESLPQYETTIQRKLKTLDEATVGRLRLLTLEASRLIEVHETADTVPGRTGDHERPVPTRPASVVMLQSQDVSPQPLQLIGKLLTSVWAPLQATGIVLLVLIFVLLEYESLRDRFIRLIGATDIRSTTLALNDAGDRLSRFFVSQFAVNLCFGAAIWAILSVLRVPQAMLLGALAGVLRFVPYMGVWIAALFSAALAFAVDPGWSLVAGTLGVFVLLDIIVAQLLEPQLYGHATGLSPLAVVVAAIFWGTLWGPVGLILSTPLTLCLVVAGRHVKALGILELLSSDAQPLTLPQRFYQRALSGDPHEIIANARAFLKRDSLVAYCDRVLIPALHFVRLDTDMGATSEDQRRKIGRVILDVVAALSSNGLKFPRRRRRGSVLEDVSAGRWLRQQREQLSGKWQGPLGVPPGSVVICLGLGSSDDDLAAELLARLLRMQKIDARNFSPEDLHGGLPPGADPEGVSIVYLVSAFPSPERDRAESIGRQVHELFPRAYLVKVFPPGVIAPPELGESAGNADHMASSLVQAIQIGMSWQEERDKT
ncbi:MAG: AI-2E family transporter [Sulfuricaulis sp.]|uniref:AI-2E family transporter n=1 Tax=Sulfuricaulis sp. TaxID=2003553 RepID=UPI003C4BBB5B